MPSVSKSKSPKPSAPKKSPKTAKPWKTAEELQAMIAERSGERAQRIAIYGEPGNWGATLLVNQVGNAERKARVRSIVSALRGEFDLSG